MQQYNIVHFDEKVKFSKGCNRKKSQLPYEKQPALARAAKPDVRRLVHNITLLMLVQFVFLFTDIS